MIRRDSSRACPCGAPAHPCYGARCEDCWALVQPTRRPGTIEEARNHHVPGDRTYARRSGDDGNYSHGVFNGD